MGSIPIASTNDLSVRTNKTDRYENQSVKWLIFSFAKNHPKSIKKGCLSYQTSLLFKNTIEIKKIEK